MLYFMYKNTLLAIILCNVGAWADSFRDFKIQIVNYKLPCARKCAKNCWLSRAFVSCMSK